MKKNLVEAEQIPLLCKEGNTLTTFEWSRPRELRWIDSDVGPDFFQRKGVLSIGPGHQDAKRQLHTRDLAVVGVVDLRGYRANGSFVPAHQPNQQAGFIEVKVDRSFPRVRALKNLNRTVVDDGAADFPVAERFLDAGRKR